LRRPRDGEAPARRIPGLVRVGGRPSRVPPRRREPPPRLRAVGVDLPHEAGGIASHRSGGASAAMMRRQRRGGGYSAPSSRSRSTEQFWSCVTSMVRTLAVRTTDGLYKDFEEALRRVGLTRAGLARRAHTQAAAVRRLLGKTNGHNPTLSTLSKLAAALGYQVRLVEAPGPQG